MLHLVRRGCIVLLAGPQFLWSYSVSFTLGDFDSDKLWKVRRRTVFGHMIILVESQCFPKFDTSGSKFRLVNTNLASAEVHCPLNFGFSMSHIVFQGIKQVCTIPGGSLPCPAQASLVIPEQATQNRGRISPIQDNPVESSITFLLHSTNQHWCCRQPRELPYSIPQQRCYLSQGWGRKYR